MTEIKPGQVWRRKADGVETTVTSVDSSGAFRRAVHHKARRSTGTEYAAFIRKYEFVKEADRD